MAVNVRTGSVRIDIKPNDAHPALFAGASVIAHLTKGFSPAGVAAAIATGNSKLAFSGQAWTATADFKLDTADKTEIGKFEFGFIQTAFSGLFNLQYAGAKRLTGGIVISPTIQNNTFLDSEVGFTPWTKPPADRQSGAGADIQCPTGDHPSVRVAPTLDNLRTKIPNFLFALHHTTHFTTILSKFEKATFKVEAIAHFEWTLRYAFELKWRGGKPFVAANRSTLTFSAVKPGEPGDPDVKKIFRERSGQFYNTVVPASLVSAVTGKPPLRVDEPEWHLNVPANFFG
jgi:hypothetical protein